jgi:hypothetical protein
MKKSTFILAAICFLASGLSAQNYTTAKNLLALNQYAKAKEDFDKSITNAKYAGKPEAWILKTCIYAGLAMADENKGKPEGEQLATEADAAFTKYKEMDPSMKLVDEDLVYRNGPINLYSSYYTEGYGDYTAKKYPEAFQKLKKAVSYSDLLIDKKIIGTALDTNVLILAGVTAEQTDQRDDAAKYYGRLADNKVTGDGFESVYRFLVSYNFEKRNMEAFKKYKDLGKELYPKSEFFDYDKVDFAVGLASNFSEKLKAIDDVLATDPNNYKANEVLGELIFDTLNPHNDEAKRPENAPEMEAKMLMAFKKAAAAEPNNELAYIYMGDHYIHKAVRATEAKKTADAKTKTELDTKYGDAMEGAREPYLKAAEIFAARSASELNARDKQQYKKVTSYLADIYAYKKVHSKANSPDQAKYAAEEKKWNEVYDSIK